jgi:hypothetical protein
MASLSEGQRVRIVAGSYKKHGFGTYMGPYGKVMCCVKVDGDTVQQRHLWLTSIRPMMAPKSGSAPSDKAPKAPSADKYSTESTAESKEFKVSKSDLQTMLDEVTKMRAAMEEFETTLKTLLQK